MRGKQFPNEIITQRTLRDIPTREEFKIRAIQRGVTFRQLASELGVVPAIVSRVVAGEPVSRRVFEYLMARLGFAREAK